MAAYAREYMGSVDDVGFVGSGLVYCDELDSLGHFAKLYLCL